MAELPDTIVPIRETGDRTPLFCVHPVSGSAYTYLGLAGLLRDDQPVYGFEAPGYDDGEDPLTTLGDMSRLYVSLLREHWAGRPVNLLGWSLGGVVAFDMAQRLTATGTEVPMVVIVDAETPEVSPLRTEKAMLQTFMHDLLSISNIAAPALAPLLTALPNAADPAAVFADIERSAILPEEVDAELLEHRYRIYRTHVAASHAFEIDGTYSGAVTLIRGSKTPDELLRWGPVALNLDEQTIEGDHHSIWTGESLVAMADIVTRRLG